MVNRFRGRETRARHGLRGAYANWRAVTAMCVVVACGGAVALAAEVGSAQASVKAHPATASYVTAAQKTIAAALKKPTSVLETAAFKPKRGQLIYNISCNLAIVGCSEISSEVGDAVKALGDKFQRCNAGATPSQAQSCFTNAVNAHAAAIVTNDVAANSSGSGYHQAAAAKIPIIGAFTANPENTPDEPTQAAENAPTVEATLLADYVIAKSNGKAHVLFVGENTDQDGVYRGKAFAAAIKKCTTCKSYTVQTDNNTLSTTGGPAITAALEAHPDVNWVVGNFDEAAALSVLAAEKLGKASSIQVGGMDADPQNLQYIKEHKVQVVDATVGQGEVAWAAVYSASRVLSGYKVPLATPVNIWLIDPSNIKQVPSSGLFFGPNNYQSKFEALWKK
jgi:ABC-type sugar transport system substrate-binding protein